MYRKHMDVCEWTEIECPFRTHGCSVNGTGHLMRKYMPKHQSDEANAHSLLVAKAISEIKQSITDMREQLADPTMTWNVSVDALLTNKFITSPQWNTTTKLGIYKCSLEMYLMDDEQKYTNTHFCQRRSLPSEPRRYCNILLRRKY